MDSERNNKIPNNVNWRKAKRSAGNGACIEAAILDDESVGVRDTKQSQDSAISDKAPIMRFSPEEWDSLTEKVKGDLEMAAALVMGEAVSVTLDSGRTLMQVPNEDGGVDWVKSDQPDVIHEFSFGDFILDNTSEIGAAVLGFIDGEFDYQTLFENQQLVAA